MQGQLIFELQELWLPFQLNLGLYLQSKDPNFDFIQSQNSAHLDTLRWHVFADFSHINEAIDTIGYALGHNFLLADVPSSQQTLKLFWKQKKEKTK